MYKNGRLALILSVTVSLLMIVVAINGILGPSGTSSSSHFSGAVAMPRLSAPHAIVNNRDQSVMSQLESRGIPARYVYLPNFNSGIHRSGNVITPSYGASPAPMGIGFYGIDNVDGKLVPYNLTTSSYEGTVNFSSLQDLYPLDDGPTSITVQMNAVLDNVALFGNSNYSFWTQNVMFYSARTHSIEFLDNIWNFSSPSFDFTQNSLYNYSGYPEAPVFYYALGPIINVTYPFQVSLYLNTTVLNGRSTVFFNYSVSFDGKTHAGTYDRVEFNSIPGSDPSYKAPQPTYLVSGNTITPTGFIPYDAEIILGGPGGGSTANVYSINATMQLQYLNNTVYHTVPSAYDVGSETGETSQGVSVSWTPQHKALLTAGPSFVYGMWGIQNNSSMESYSGSLNPSNSFVFATSSTYANQTAWVPLSLSGNYEFSLPAADYRGIAMLSDHTPVSFAFSTSKSTTLHENFSEGIYTPLYALDNQQLNSIANYTDGTYVLYHNGMAQINSSFGELNDYAFPGFMGILLSGITDNVVIENMPSLNVSYTGFNLLLTSFYGLPDSNEMGLVLYNSTNVSVTNNSLSGWFSANLNEFPVANLLLWNSRNISVSNNTFITMDSSMLVYNQNHTKAMNLIYHNRFIQSSSLNRFNYAPIAVSTTFGTSPVAPTGLTIYSSGNKIYGNLFAVYLTAISPSYSIYTGNNVKYHDMWNSTGGVGNAWWNYNPVHGNFAYDNYGLITSGKDYDPVAAPVFSGLVHNFK